ncbi:MAG: ribosome biogenesis GTPase Der [Gammaproteobacteria bacterium RIFCSPHIGHO2_12_FULL_37_34]|nr:MAG: ribosome biogenesis GTPase Der [Gammaproteobacteria bacterium RIFCSPHIGHO2_12_FULL_37_34]
MLPVVAIVGRPNVGKSTLFNCLTHTKNALMSSHPGTTRDRQYGEVHIDNHRFIIIDTGGIIEKPNDIGKLITQQALTAIQEADHIIFLVDGREGVLAEDKMIANMLRKTSKPVLLVINKTEGLDTATSALDAHELGMGMPIAIAAAHRIGITNLITTLFPLPIEETESKAKPTSAIKLAIVGKPNVGKSTLTNRMLGEDRVIVHDTPGTTRDSIYIPLERFHQHYTLIDTAGVRKRKKVSDVPEKFSIVKTLQAIEDAHVVLYLIDARTGVGEQDLKLLGFVLECGKALVIAVNKWDGMIESAREEVKKSMDRQLGFVHFARTHYISALHGSGVGILFDSIHEAYLSATKKLSTPLLARLLQQAIVTHSPPLVRGRRVKLRYAHPGGNNPPTIIIHGNQVDALPESYRRFLAAFFQKKLKLRGTPVVIEWKEGKNPFSPRNRKKH